MPERVRVQREGVQLQAQGTWSAGEDDNKQRFLADLRTLRDRAALEWDELAVRAHYPSDVLKEAENGPTLPGLPILAAYVRACEGDVPEWEERWRRLCAESHAVLGLPVRPAGASPAALAGARAGVSVAPPDAYDPERIRAALRGFHHGRSDQGARGIAGRSAAGRLEPDPATTEPGGPASWKGGTSWDEAARWDETARWDGATAGLDGALAGDVNSALANGSHHAGQPEDRPSADAVVETPDAAQADVIRRDPFSSDWLRDGGLTSPPDPEPGRQDRTEAKPASADGGGWFTPPEAPDREQAWPTADPDQSAAATDTWFTPHGRADGALARDAAPPSPSAQEHAGPAAAGVTGFWTPWAAAPAPAEARRPAPPTPGHAVPRASWTAPADPSVGDTPGASDWATPVPAQAAGAGAAPSRTIAGPAVPPGPVVPPSEPRPERPYAVRLLVVIVVAALIGSILVLLLR